jgi:serine protease AprX
MKRISLIIFAMFLLIFVNAQDIYWVFLTDKNNTEFNPYEYFDEKAIERRLQHGVSLYDISDFPINDNYKTAVSSLSNELIGESRWLNALAVSASVENIALIESLDFVKGIVQIESHMVLCSVEQTLFDDDDESFHDILPQLKRMEGEAFINNNIDGSGIRIAVLDGGFEGADTHEAFFYLRENNRIIATYNFARKNEDVYNGSTHGTMVLSCIAGFSANYEKMGLATGAEFLLARTEVNMEPAKEEVWWMMAMEWADKNGAKIINSSLGYGGDRHYTYDMDGKTTLVTKAANMAAAKGILVCNSMGNEATKASWRTLIAPADADSVLAVGGINPFTNRHISFSSLGPTADGRVKPNVVADGNVRVANAYSFSRADGTSFSSPLVAGFAACAWQSKPELSNMELKTEIEKSGDNYPYYDYAFGYGVPQADHFVNDFNKEAERSFTIKEDKYDIIINVPRNDKYDSKRLLYHIRNSEGIIILYEHIEFWLGSSDEIRISKSTLLPDRTIMIFCNGYTEEFGLSQSDIESLSQNQKSNLNFAKVSGHNKHLSKRPVTDKPSSFGANSKYYIQPYFVLGLVGPPYPQEYDMKVNKSSFTGFGLRYFRNITKMYKLGMNMEMSASSYHIENLFGEYSPDDYKKYNEFVQTGLLSAELFQRFRLVPGTMTGLGLFFDTGIYGSWIAKTTYNLDFVTNAGNKRKLMIDNNEQFFVWGLRGRFGYSAISLYAQYRMSDLKVDDTYTLPKLELGFELSIPMGF